MDINEFFEEEIKLNNNNLLTPKEAVYYIDNILIRFLGYFGSELCVRGIETYIEKIPTNVILREITFRILSSGLLTQKNYKLIIENEDIKSKFKENPKNWLNFLENLKSKISKEFNIETKDILYFGNKIDNFEVNFLIFNQRINGIKNYIRNLNLKLKITTFTLLNYFILSPCIFESDYCKNEKEWKKNTLIRGGKNYNPPYGWYGISLKLNKFGKSNNIWLGKDNKEGEWAVAFHGIKKENGNIFDKIVNIINGNLKEEIEKTYEYDKNIEKNSKNYPNCGEGIILYTNIQDVEDHSDKASLGFFNCKFQFAFMMRVNTNKIRKPDIFPEKWILNGNYEEIRPYRLLIKII